MADINWNDPVEPQVLNFEANDVQSYRKFLMELSEKLTGAEDADNTYNKYYFLCMAKCPELRRSETEALKALKRSYTNINKVIPENFLGIRKRNDMDKHEEIEKTEKNLIRIETYLNYLNIEAAAIAKFNEREKTDKNNQLMNAFNVDLYMALSGSRTDVDEGDKIENVRKAIEQQSFFVSKLIEREDRISFIKGNNAKLLNTAVYGDADPDRIIKSINAFADEDDIEALTQNSGNFGAKNSIEYDRISETLMDLNREMHVPGGSSYAYLNAAYNALITYLRTHDSVPSSDNGKLRVNAAARVCVKIGLEIMDKFPDRQHDLLKDFRVQMLRNRAFRTSCITESKALVRQFSGLYPDTFDVKDYNTNNSKLQNNCNAAFSMLRFATLAEDTLKKENSSAIIKGKVKTPEAEKALLDKYKDIVNISEKAENFLYNFNSNERFNLADGKIFFGFEAYKNKCEREFSRILMDNTMSEEEKDKALLHTFAELIYRQGVHNEVAKLHLPDDDVRYRELRDEDNVKASIAALEANDSFKAYYNEHKNQMIDLSYSRPRDVITKFRENYEKYVACVEHPSRKNNKAYNASNEEITRLLQPVNPFEIVYDDDFKLQRHVNAFIFPMEKLPYNTTLQEAKRLCKEYANPDKLMSYQKFRENIRNIESLQNMPEVSEDIIREKNELRQKGFDALVTLAYNRAVVGIPYEILDKFGGTYRSISTCCYKYGREYNDENLRRANVMINGTQEERKKLFDDILGFYADLDVDLFTKQYTDEEFIEAWPKIYNFAAPLAMELSGVIDYFEKTLNVEADPELLKKINENAKIVSPIYTYFSMRMSKIVSEYGRYIPDDYKIDKDNDDFDDVRDALDFKVSRTIDSVDNSFVDEALVEYVFGSAPAIKGKKVESIYLEDGTKVEKKASAQTLETDPELVKHFVPGKKIIMHFKDDRTPYVISVEKLGMPPVMKEYSAKPYMDIDKPIYKERLEAHKNIANSITQMRTVIKNRENGRKVDVLGEALSKIFCMRIIDQRIDTASENNIRIMLGEGMNKNVEQMKKSIGEILNSYTPDELNDFVANGSLERVVDGKLLNGKFLDAGDENPVGAMKVEDEHKISKPNRKMTM